MTTSKHSEYGQYGQGMVSLARSFKFAFVTMVCIISAIVVWFFTFEGYFTVMPDENVIHMRFGKVIAVHEDGAHWSFSLTDSLVTVPTNVQRFSVISYLRKDNALSGEEMNTSPLAPGVDGYLITGDENIVHSSWKVEYRITNPKSYYLNTLTPRDISKEDDVLFDAENDRKVGSRGPRTILKTLFESVVVKVTAGQEVQNTLYSTSTYVAEVKSEYIKLLNQQKYLLGITVDNVILDSKAPPAGTKQAFEDVQNAVQERSSLQQEALAYKVNVENETLSESARLKADAEAYKIRAVSQVDAERIYFEKILKEYKKSPDTVLISLYNDVLGNALKSARDRFMIRSKKDGMQEIRIKLNRRPKGSTKKSETGRQ